MVTQQLTKGSGLIDFEEFLQVMTSRIGDQSSRQELERVYRLFDTDTTGSISVQNMQKISAEVGDNLTEEELAEVLKRCDIDEDTACTFEDFYNVITHKLH